MKTFRYEGVSGSGARVEGIVEAFDRQDAVVKAREHCRRLVSLEPIRSSTLDRILHMDMGELIGGKIKPKTLALLCSQLAIELKAGLPLVASLRLVADNEPNKQIRKMLLEVAEDVHAGNPLADSFTARGKGLPASFIETVRAGEESGRLDACFEKLQTYYENAAEITAKVSSAMIYPTMLLIVAAAVIGIIMISAVPVFQETFANLGNELPLPTKLLIAISGFMARNWLVILLCLGFLVLGLVLYGKTGSGRHFYARLALTVPGLQLVNKMKASSQLSSTLSTMLSAGLPLVRAVEITAATLDNLLVGEEILAAANGVLEGRTMSDGLRKSRWLPKLLVEMAAVGEETGKLEDTLDVVSQYYNREVDSAVKKALEILNPVITIVLAVIVVFILLSVYLPLFSMYASL